MHSTPTPRRRRQQLQNAGARDNELQSYDGRRRFSFATLHALTPHLLGSERAAVFAALPMSLQRQAWAESVKRTNAYNGVLFAESQEDDGA